ncbi:hypothetical protein EV424DRAFT_1332318, partial [Suillus variegatus]
TLMSDNGNGPSQPPADSSQTMSFRSEHPTRLSDAECVEKCNELVEQYRRRENPKVDTILALQQTLLDSPTVEEGGSLPDALAVFVSMLDSIDRANGKAAERGKERGQSSQQQEAEGRTTEPGDEDQEGEERVRRERDSSESSDEDERPSKRSKGRLDTSKFPWHEKRVSAIAALSPDIKQTFEQLERFSVDPKGVVRDILSTPGCPPFPPEQWLNIVQWKVVDLGKVLEAAHSTDLEPKQTHVIDDKVELSFRASKSTAGIHSASDHNIAFTKYINALTFIFPQRWEEYTSWNAHMSGLFHAFETSRHSRVIEYDKAARTLVSLQRHIHLTDYSAFGELQYTFLSSFGVGPNSSESGTGGGGKSDRTSGGGGRKREPCHKWNRGTCLKSSSECYFSHCCDRKGCRGAHKKSDCTRLSKTGEGSK